MWPDALTPALSHGEREKPLKKGNFRCLFAFTYSFGPALTSASPAGVSVYFLEVLNKQFRQRFGFFLPLLPGNRRCYAGQGYAYPRPAAPLE